MTNPDPSSSPQFPATGPIPPGPPRPDRPGQYAPAPYLPPGPGPNGSGPNGPVLNGVDPYRPDLHVPGPQQHGHQNGIDQHPHAPGPQQYGPQQYGQYPPQNIVVTAPKSAGVAILLSLLWFGAGHLYANQTGVGIALVVYDLILGILSITVVGLVVSIPLWLISLPIVMILAANAANGYNRRNGLVVH